MGRLHVGHKMDFVRDKDWLNFGHGVLILNRFGLACPGLSKGRAGQAALCPANFLGTKIGYMRTGQNLIERKFFE